MSKTQPLHTSDKLKIHKLSQAQFQRESEAGNLDPSALYVTPEESLIIKLNGGNTEGVDKFTYNGSHQKTINISLGSESPLGHSHDIYLESISEQSADYEISSDGGTYVLEAGGSSCTIGFPSTKLVENQQLTSESASGNYPLLVMLPPNINSTLVQTSATGSPMTSSQRHGGLYLEYDKSAPSTPTLHLPGDLDVNSNIVANEVQAQFFIASSDKRLKENCVLYSPVASILDLPIYTFNFIADPEKNTHLGCLAQDLQKICPELVYTKQDGYLGIEENKLVYLLLDEVKKLKAELSELRTTIEK